MKNASRVPERKDVPKGDTWNLGPMYRSDAAWERDRKALEGELAPFAAFQGKLGRSAKMLRKCFDAEYAFRRRLDKLVVYANLRHMEDVACPKAQGMSLRASFLATRAQEALSFIVPEFNTIPAATVRAWLKGPELAPYAFVIRELLRIRPHVLSPKEELLLAMQGETAETASRVFGQLTDADLRFGTAKDASGKEIELTHASMGLFRECPKRSSRREAFEKYHKVYEAHGNTLAAAMAGSVAQDVYQARVRRFGSTIEARLFDDKVPVSVFDTLVSGVRAALPTLHRCLDIRRRALRLKDYHVYDNYVPLAPAPGKGQPYDAAVETVCDAVTPLGDEYVRLLRAGLTAGRWVDKYENRNKHSGAFSWGCYDSP
ncbi:MAG TPA: M3 family metallopeptidase, partial [Candidatus Hydrogenedentes bacterium]|nr:M3 family metallopeptidase [Candidatus Hydrogenedentota bacterium]